MANYQTATFTLSIFTLILLPTLGFALRGAIKWAKIESKVDRLIVDLRELVIDKDKVHMHMVEQMKADRDATNQRLRWLEEHLWKRRNDNAV